MNNVEVNTIGIEDFENIRFITGMTNEELAQKLGLSESTVKSYFYHGKVSRKSRHRLLENFRQIIESESYEMFKNSLEEMRLTNYES